MNIKEAKNEVMKAVKIYLEKDEHGEYRVPVVRQRPLFLQGAQLRDFYSLKTI